MMRISLIQSAIALLLLWGSLPVMGQQTFTIASNLPPRLLAGAGVAVQSPPNIFNPFALAPNAFHTGGDGNYTVLWTPALGLNNPALLSPTMTFPTPSAQTQYVLTVTDGNGCLVRDTVMIDFSTGAKDGQALQLNMTIFPNPNNGDFSLQLQGRPISEELRLHVADAMGRVLATERLPRFDGSLRHPLTFQGLGAGMYFLTIEAGSKRAVRSFVIH
jgi:hypothetical protein